MKLKNSFSDETRHLFLYVYKCFKCFRSDRGLELHHITGRGSNAPLNAVPLCLECHSHVGHTHEEEVDLFKKTLGFLIMNDYKPRYTDINFIKKNPHLEQALMEII